MNLQNALLRLPDGGPEQLAVAAGEIDAVIDYANSNVILFPAARRALRNAPDRKAATQASGANSLLAALPRAEYRGMLAGFEPVKLKYGEVLHEPGVPIRHVYFPVDCVVCLLTAAQGHQPLAIGLVGHEGMIGISLALGVDASFARAVVQGTGTALRMESAPFLQNFLQSQPLRQALHRYEHALMGQIAQSAACNQFHSVQARIARYLLTTGDLSGSSEFHLTQEFLADMLGVRRVSVTNAAGVLRKRKLIKYSKGHITILDRQGLSAVACGCYKVVSDSRQQRVA